VVELIVKPGEYADNRCHYVEDQIGLHPAEADGQEDHHYEQAADSDSQPTGSSHVNHPCAQKRSGPLATANS